jgi:hypothetical protein
VDEALGKMAFLYIDYSNFYNPLEGKLEVSVDIVNAYIL